MSNTDRRKLYRKGRIKFLINNALDTELDNTFWMNPEESLEGYLKKNWGLSPLLYTAPYPAREGGWYYQRYGKGEYKLFVFVKNRWWECDHLITCSYTNPFDTELCLSEKELQSIFTMLQTGKRKWLTPEALDKFRRYLHEQELRLVQRSYALSTHRILKELEADRDSKLEESLP